MNVDNLTRERERESAQKQMVFFQISNIACFTINFEEVLNLNDNLTRNLLIEMAAYPTSSVAFKF